MDFAFVCSFFAPLGEKRTYNIYAVLFLLLYFVFALCERKNEIQKKEKYLAAAGKSAHEEMTA
jgi:hypothetical protein